MSICDFNRPALFESIDSRSGRIEGITTKKNDSWEMRIFIWGSMDECVVRDRVEDPLCGFPATFKGLPFESYTLNNIGWNVWEATGKYMWFGPKQTDGTGGQLPSSITMTTSGGRIKLTQSFYTSESYPMNNTRSNAPNFDGAIEWDGKNVNGVDVPAAAPRYTETWIFPRSRIFYGAIQTYPIVLGDGVGGEAGSDRYNPDEMTFPLVEYTNLMALWTGFTGAVHGIPQDVWNRREASFGAGGVGHGSKEVFEEYPQTQYGNFRNWKQGNVLLAGVQVTQVAIDSFEVTFEFQINEDNQLDLPPDVLGTPADSIEKAGWDYTWLYYGKNKKLANKTEGAPQQYQVTASVPKYAYVEQVYRRVDFNWLGIGVLPFTSAPQGPSSACPEGVGYEIPRCNTTS